MDTIKIAILHSREIDKAKHRGKISEGVLTNTERFMAMVSRMSYLFVKEEGLEERLYENDDEYILYKGYSDKNSIVYVNREKNSAVIGFRGTMNFISDMTANTLITLGKFESSTRFKEALIKYNIIKKNFSLVRVTGHSLGGTQAVGIGRYTGCEVHAFAPAQGIDIRRIIRNKNRFPNIHTYHIVGDPVSMFCGFEYMSHNNRFDPPNETYKMLDRHYLSAFLGPWDEESDHNVECNAGV